MNTRKWREYMKIAGITLLVTAGFALLQGTEDRIVNGGRIGADAADLVATAPTCYCQETCR